MAAKECAEDGAVMAGFETVDEWDGLKEMLAECKQPCLLHCYFISFLKDNRITGLCFLYCSCC